MHKHDWSGFKEKMGKRNGRTDIDHSQKEEKGQSPEGWCGFVCVVCVCVCVCMCVCVCVCEERVNEVLPVFS